jgi:hypothetical protein
VAKAPLFSDERVVEGGLIIIDDYYAWDGCSRAVHEYLAQTGATERLRSSHGVCYIVKLTESDAVTKASCRCHSAIGYGDCLTDTHRGLAIPHNLPPLFAG